MSSQWLPQFESKLGNRAARRPDMQIRSIFHMMYSDLSRLDEPYRILSEAARLRVGVSDG